MSALRFPTRIPTPRDASPDRTYDSTGVSKGVDGHLAFLPLVKTGPVGARGLAVAGGQRQQERNGEREGLHFDQQDYSVRRGKDERRKPRDKSRRSIKVVDK